MRDRTQTVILPTCDSEEVQAIYKTIADFVEQYNEIHQCQILNVQFDVVGGSFGGMQRDYRGCYVYRDRSAVL